ncbi:Phage-integrase repeat unit [Methylophilaceae bacterium]
MDKPIKSKFRPFVEAREYVRNLHLLGQKEYFAWSKTSERPEDIPTNPLRTYPEEWTSWGDWLGTLTIAPINRTYRPFIEARTFVRSLNFKSKKEFAKWSKSVARPQDIPATPERTYKNEWISWGDWLGTFTISNTNRTFRPFAEAWEFAQSLNFESRTEWVDWSKSSDKPSDIPSTPAQVYKTEWTSWGDWLGTLTIAPINRTYRPFIEARTFVRSLNFKSGAEYNAWKKTTDKPQDIPTVPERTYKNEWISWGDWLGSYVRWSSKALIGFVKSLYPILPHLDPSELYAILRNNNCLKCMQLCMQNGMSNLLIY